MKLSANNYKAIAVVGYKDNPKFPGDKSKMLPVRRTKSGFKNKTEAMAYISVLKREKKPVKSITLKAMYDKWFPTHKAAKSTLNCYQAGFKVFEDCWYVPMSDQDIDELQECVDNCGKGIKTRKNAKTALGLVYKYGIPRGYVPDKINLAEFVKPGEGESAHKPAFTTQDIETIKNSIDTVPYADYIYCHCYLGFRPTAFLALDVEDYNAAERAFVGGIKTEAGIDRTVTVSPKIQPIIDRLITQRTTGALFCGDNGKRLTIKEYRTIFYAALAAMNVQAENVHLLTPHSCRHTFATLMKSVQAPDKDKLSLIGHTTTEQLMYYQDVNYADLRKITDAL